MVTAMKRIKKVLANEFSSKEIQLDRTKSGSISGWVISKSFESLSAIDRQNRVWKLLNEHLDPEDRECISSILTMTPQEQKRIVANWESRPR